MKKVGEQNEVQDDFELICFDLVSSPSTPGAYLFTEPNERFNFEENLEEENKMRAERTTGMSGDSIDKQKELMKKLSAYLDR